MQTGFEGIFDAIEKHIGEIKVGRVSFDNKIRNVCGGYSHLCEVQA